MAQRNRENGVTLPSVKINFTERSVPHEKEKEKTVSRGEERFPGMGLPGRVSVKGRTAVPGRRLQRDPAWRTVWYQQVMRHSYASIRISKGDNIGDVSNQLGHHSVKLTLDIYYHWIPGKKKAEVDALDDPSLKIPSAPHLHPDTLENKKGLTISG
jgi:hypothetical protein